VADSTRIDQAAALHRQAAAVAEAAELALEAQGQTVADPREQYRLAEQLRAAAGELAPGWLGATLDAQSPITPLGGPHPPQFVRIGMAQPLDDARFPAIVPLLGVGHLTVDQDARDPRVSGLIRSVLLRLLATAPAGSLLVRAVDCAGGGAVFAPFAALADAGLMSPPATDRDGLRAVLHEAEQWLRPVRGNSSRRSRRQPAGERRRRRAEPDRRAGSAGPRVGAASDRGRLAAAPAHSGDHATAVEAGHHGVAAR
jgi:S-DNA-T family DNA segregation ATPase FtsK/SpoIIIE